MSCDLKLFGRTITSIFPQNHYDQSKEASSSSSSSSCSLSLEQDTVLANKNEQDNSRFKDLSDLNEPQKATSEISSPRSSKNSEITSTSEDKLKKPDKILPCPRCESTNTKFCYYNNYNVSQPRHFCRNCQRYWTAGGSMRNVPVGSGRRKNKCWPSSSNHYLHVTSQDYDNNNSKTILSFGSSDSSVAETSKHQSVDTPSQEHKRFLPPQVIFPWPNASFYPVPFYWGCTVPLWHTFETSPCLGKRSRDQTQGDETITRRARLVSKPLEVNTEPTKIAIETKKKQQGFSLFDGFETKSSNNIRSLVSETSLSLQVNPAAMSRSMNFRENMLL